MTTQHVWKHAFNQSLKKALLYTRQPQQSSVNHLDAAMGGGLHHRIGHCSRTGSFNFTWRHWAITEYLLLVLLHYLAVTCFSLNSSNYEVDLQWFASIYVESSWLIFGSSLHISFTFRYVPEGIFLLRRQDETRSQTSEHRSGYKRQDSPMLTSLLPSLKLTVRP